MADTLMTPADSAADAGASGAGPAAAASAAAAPAAQPDAAQSAKPGEGPAAGDKPAADQGAGEADASNGGKPAAEGAKEAKPDDAGDAPIEYTDFKLPDGVTLPDEFKGELTTFAKGLKLPQDQAQALIDLGAKQAQEFVRVNEARVAEVRQSWVTEAQTDPEFGGEKLAVSLPVAQKALKTFGSEKLTELLNGTGLGNHPEVIRLLYKVGQAIGEDGVVTGNGDGGKGAPQDRAKKMYPGMA